MIIDYVNRTKKQEVESAGDAVIKREIHMIKTNQPSAGFLLPSICQ